VRHVVATAGHVDHGKSTLVRALTGMEPDRWAEERRRGLTLDLGFAWTQIGAHQVAFVDVPGHERFVTNMLAGVGPAPAVLFVVAADGGWMPQSAEHLEALDALGVRHGLLVVSRCDLADPAPARTQALAALARTSLGPTPAVEVSAATGAGLDTLRGALSALVTGVPTADDNAPVRLWIDRSFTIGGAGTVVTGTLGAGVIRVDDELLVEPGGRRVRVRGLESTGEQQREVRGTSRVAVNLRGVEPGEVRRGRALVTPERWTVTAELDVRLHADGDERLPAHAVLHAGAAAVNARLRRLGADVVRVHLDRPVPLHVGDRALLREPGEHRIVGGATVLDVRPPALVRRGAAADRARSLADASLSDVQAEVRRRHVVHERDLVAMGYQPTTAPVAGGWHVDQAALRELAEDLRTAVTDWAHDHPLDGGLPVEAARQRLGLPDVAVVDAVRRLAGLRVAGGRVLPSAGAGLPPTVQRAVEQVLAGLVAEPFAAPDTERLRSLSLGPGELAAAIRAGALLRVADGIVLAPAADRAAAAVLSALPQPFTTSQARQALGTTRRVAIPLLELLDRNRLTRRGTDDRREVVVPQS
jgi:selenocysteine-specific elongation factor